jgi:hypothetical protein
MFNLRIIGYVDGKLKIRPFQWRVEDQSARLTFDLVLYVHLGG